MEGKNALFAFGRARQTPTSLFSRVGVFFFTTKQLSGDCQLIDTEHTIILLLRMNESRVVVRFFFFTGICTENGWRIDNETRARLRNYEPNSGGSEIIVCNLNQETSRFGWNVSVEIYLIRLIIHIWLIVNCFKNIWYYQYIYIIRVLNKNGIVKSQ